MTKSDPCPDQARTLTRAHLADAVYRRVGLSRTESAFLVEMFLGELTDSLARGEPVKISSFGSFLVRSKRSRMGRNPRTGVQTPITPRRVMVFRPSKTLKGKVRGDREPARGSEGAEWTRT